MTITIDAVYENGVLRPRAALELSEGVAVELTLRGAAPVYLTEAEAVRLLEQVKSFDDLKAVWDRLPPDEGDYNIEERLRENRRFSGYPEELL